MMPLQLHLGREEERSNHLKLANPKDPVVTEKQGLVNLQLWQHGHKQSQARKVLRPTDFRGKVAKFLIV